MKNPCSTEHLLQVLTNSCKLQLIKHNSNTANQCKYTGTDDTSQSSGDARLAAHPTCGNVVGSYQHTWMGSKLISGPSPTPKTRLLSCNRTQSRVVTALLTIHNTLRKHLYLMGLTNSPLCRRCGAEEETSAHVLCECEALALLTHAFWVPFSWTQRTLKSLNVGTIWNCRNKSPVTWHQIMGHNRPV